MHFDKRMTYLNQPASTPIPNQTQEFHQCYQVNKMDISQESTLHVDSNFEYVPSSFHSNQITEFEQDVKLDTAYHEPPIEQFFDDDSIFLDKLVKNDFVIHTTSMKHVDHNVEDVCVNDEPMFSEELFKDECDHNSEKTC